MNKNKTLLISLISDQTLPNVQIIKEFSNKNVDFLFITTQGMENKGIRGFIEKTCNIDDSKKIEVDQFSFSNVNEKLKSINYDEYNKIIVNITGGTKIMTLATSDFFKNIGAEIYYVTGKNQEYIKTFPQRNLNTFKLKINITLSDYLTAYGFKFNKENKLSGISYKQSKKIFECFCNKIDEYKETLQIINSNRNKKIINDDFIKIKKYLDYIEFKPSKSNELSKKETKYLSGDWFEEYIGLTIKEELKLSNENIFIGTIISKTPPLKTINDTKELLGPKVKLSEDNFNNEMDVMFVYENKFYTIECKSSIIAIRPNNGKEYNILGETIYKSDSLKTRFGLYANTSIVTLTDFSNYLEDSDEGKQNNKIREMKELINRANLSGIKLIDKSLLCNNKKCIFELFK